MMKMAFSVLGTSALAIAANLFTAAPAHACSADSPYLGTVCYFAFNFCPRGFVQASGQVVAVSEYQALAALFGNTYGGDGRTTFGIPDLRGRTPVGSGTGRGLTPVPWGQPRGAEKVVLNSAQAPLAAHTHQATFAPVVGTQTITIPAQAGSGTSLTGTGTFPVNTATPTSPAAPNLPANGAAYYMTGRSSGGYGPYTSNAPTTGQVATVQGVAVAVDASGMVPASPQRNVNIPAVIGGAVEVEPTDPASASAAVYTVPPQLGLTACIATTGMFPQRSD